MCDTFRTFKLQIKNLLSSKIKIFRSDGGGEFMSFRFRELFSDSGEFFIIFVAHLPLSKMVVLKEYRHMFQTGLTFLFNASMPSKYWPDALLTATYLINRMPVKHLNFISPWERLFHCEPNYSPLRVFGCTCYLWLWPYSHNKLQPRTKKCVLLGYSLNYKRYRCLDASTGRE